MELEKHEDCGEVRLQSAWNNLRPGASLLSANSETITVLSTGIWNSESGPDFKNAKIRIDGREKSGDIEIHCDYMDWFNHQHQHDSNYRNVILHVVGSYNPANIPSSKTMNVPVAVIAPDMKTLLPISDSEKFPNGKCVSFFAGIPDEKLVAFFRKNGTMRFMEKTESIKRDMISDGAEKTCLKLIFEACGYKRNRDNFIELFMRSSEYLDDSHTMEDAEAVIWGESGLLPDPSASSLDSEMKAFITEIWRKWWNNRLSDRAPIEWIRDGIRPLNTPERRIAGLCVLLSKISLHPLDFFSRNAASTDDAGTFASMVTGQLSCNDHLWDNLINFRSRKKAPSSVIGKARATDIAVNVLFPCLYAHASIRGDRKLMELSGQAWQNTPVPQPNKIFRVASHRWFLPPERHDGIIKDAAAFQGVHHLFRNYCEKCSNNCSECLIGNIAMKNFVD